MLSQACPIYPNEEVCISLQDLQKTWGGGGGGGGGGGVVDFMSAGILYLI